jgi:hypothetical protein
LDGDIVGVDISLLMYQYFLNSVAPSVFYQC